MFALRLRVCVCVLWWAPFLGLLASFKALKATIISPQSQIKINFFHNVCSLSLKEKWRVFSSPLFFQELRLYIWGILYSSVLTCGFLLIGMFCQIACTYSGGVLEEKCAASLCNLCCKLLHNHSKCRKGNDREGTANAEHNLCLQKVQFWAPPIKGSRFGK